MPDNPAASLSARVAAMEGAAFKGDWDLFKTFLTEDVYYKMGSVAEMTGPHAVADYLRKLQSTQLRITGAQIRGDWELADVVIVEMDVHANRVPDGKAVCYPSVDVFRFAGGKVREWRVYPAYPAFGESDG